MPYNRNNTIHVYGTDLVIDPGCSYMFCQNFLSRLKFHYHLCLHFIRFIFAFKYGLDFGRAKNFSVGNCYLILLNKINLN